MGFGYFLLNAVVGTSDAETALTQARTCDKAGQRLEEEGPSGEDGLAVYTCLVPEGPVVSWG